MAELPVNKLSEELVKAISQLLVDAGVPSVLWGDCLLTIYGVPSIIGGIEFVVSDEKVSIAVAALKKSNLRPCPDPWTCIVSGDSTPTPAPDFHMHIGTTEVNVSIRSHSETLWFAPPPTDLDFTAEANSLTGVPYTVASHNSLPAPRPGRGHGAFSKQGPAVRIPLSHVMLEGYIRLASVHRHEYGSVYHSMMTYVEEYIYADGLLDDTLLSEACRTFWLELKEGIRPLRELMDELQRGLGDVDSDADSGIEMSSQVSVDK